MAKGGGGGAGGSGSGAGGAGGGSRVSAAEREKIAGVVASFRRASPSRQAEFLAGMRNAVAKGANRELSPAGLRLLLRSVEREGTRQARGRAILARIKAAQRALYAPTKTLSAYRAKEYMNNPRVKRRYAQLKRREAAVTRALSG